MIRLDSVPIFHVVPNTLPNYHKILRCPIIIFELNFWLNSSKNTILFTSLVSCISEHKNIKAFLTHGGLMGTLESIYFGVPMIGVPLFGDQNFNIESYVHKKIAVSLNLNEFTEEKLTSAMKEILINPIYR